MGGGQIKKKGFTLIEMLVALAIFSIVVLVSVGSLIALTGASDKSHAILTAINNLDFAMENMSRTMRTGTKFYCADGLHPSTEQIRDCKWRRSKSTISFTDEEGRRVLYEFNESNSSVDLEVLSDIPSKTFSITSPEVDIEDLTFTLSGSSPSDALQPRVLIRIRGKTTIGGLKDSEQVEFDLQTAVTARKPDF